MKRRTLLAGVTTCAASLAGCLASGSGGGGDDDGGDGAPAAGGNPSVEDSAVRTIDTSCGGGNLRGVSATRTEDGIVVDGVIGAPNPCHEAVLEGVGIQDGRLSIRLDVESTGGVCTMCLGAIDYAATIQLANGDALEGVDVEHVGEGERAIDL